MGKPDVSSDEDLSKSAMVRQTPVLHLHDDVPDAKRVHFNDYVKVFGSFSEDSNGPRGKKLKSPGPRAGTRVVNPSAGPYAWPGVGKI